MTQGNSVGSQATWGTPGVPAETSTQGQSSACSCSGSGSGVQTANQSAGTGQKSGAASTATQDHPSNTNVSIRVLSPGGDGSVSQANTVGPGHVRQRRDDGPDGHPEPGQPFVRLQRFGLRIQSANQSAGTQQESGALSTATQDHPSNTNVSIRVLSPGDDGSVSQANTAGSIATSLASTTQNATQTQGRSGSGCGCSTAPVQQAPRGAAGRRTERRLVLGAANQSNAEVRRQTPATSASSGDNISQNTSGTGIQTGDQLRRHG